MADRPSFRTADYPADFFGPPDQRDESWPDEPDVRRAVQWLRSFISRDEWRRRQEAAADRLYGAALGESGEDDGGRFYDRKDSFGWQLFLAEAYVDHIWNYEPMFGSRVVPIFAAIGRNVEALKLVAGVEERARRLVDKDRGQPNGGIFELLVAAAYLRAGARVTFVPERPGQTKTHDLDVELGGLTWAVECKRMEVGDYGERERQRSRDLWGPSLAGLVRVKRSTLCNIEFTAPLEAVPDDYITRRTGAWLASRRASLSWDDEFGHGIITDLDLRPLKQALKTNDILVAGTRIQELLVGRYERFANIKQTLNVRMSPDHPRYVADCDLAVVLRYESLSEVAIEAKARDVLRQLAKASEQLPADRPSIVHIGFEAVEGDRVEQARHAKINESVRSFDPRGKPLEYIYCHYFVPECPPDGSWAYDETMQWFGKNGPGPLAETGRFLILPSEADSRPGGHWS